MTGLEILALAVATAWLAALTVLVLAVVRQVALLEVRLQGRPPRARGEEGPEIGSRLPRAAAESLAQLARLNGRPAYLLFLSPTCVPCLELVSALPRRDFPNPVLALFSGQDRMAADFEAMFPASVTTVRDPIATRIADLLGVQATPFALQVENSVVTGKAYLRNMDDFTRLTEAYDKSDAAEIARRAGMNDGS